MPAEVDGMFSARNMVPWHGLGNVVESVANSAEAQRLSGIEDATLEPVYVRRQFRRTDTEEFVLVPDRKAVMVPSQPQPLQIVSDRYALIQPVELFNFADTLVSTEDATYETAGSLKGQRLIWIMLRINDEIRVGKNDTLKPYLFIRDSRDGTSAMKWSLVNERVVCRNTWQVAEAEGNITSIRHRKGAMDRLQEARKVLVMARAKMESEKALVEALARATVNAKQVTNFYMELAPSPLEASYLTLTGKDRVKAEQAFEISRMHVIRDRASMLGLFEKGAGSKEAGRTAWGLFNSVTDFVDHFRQPDAKQETVMFSSLLGVGADMKANGLRLATVLAGVN